MIWSLPEIRTTIIIGLKNIDFNIQTAPLAYAVAQFE